MLALVKKPHIGLSIQGEHMEKNRIGNLLSGARLKAGLTQAQMAKQLGIRQNMVSDYERGRRTYSDAMAKRLSKTLNVKEEHLRYESDQSVAQGVIRPCERNRFRQGSCMYKAIDIAEAFERIAPKETGLADDELGFIYGEPESEVTGLACLWNIHTESINSCSEKNANMIVCH